MFVMVSRKHRYLLPYEDDIILTGVRDMISLQEVDFPSIAV